MDPQNAPQPQPIMQQPNQPTNEQPAAPHAPGQTFGPNQQAAQPQPIQVAPNGKKPNPPIAAQIIFALSIVTLLLVSLSVLAPLLLSSGSLAADAIFSTIALIILAIVGLNVFLAYSIRQGKLWALIIETVLLGLSALSLLTGDIGSLFAVLIYGPLLAILWTRNRAHFSK